MRFHQEMYRAAMGRRTKRVAGYVGSLVSMEYCTAAERHRRHGNGGDRFLVDGSVFVSASQDIFTNLALEDWIYKNWQSESGANGLLLLWRNNPCVVIGRHQNPWLECRSSSLSRQGVVLARRNSGGGTVFHDLGNLNCTFFTQRSKYDRKANLKSICSALNDAWPALRLSVSPREDILLDGTFKISGTAAKLGRTVAYHHCTVLFDVDKRRLASVLRHRGEIEGLESKATRSTESPVKNLRDVDSSIHFENLYRTIGKAFWGRQSQMVDVQPVISIIDPTEEAFPGLASTRDHLQSWDWIFGKCPPFKLSAQVTLPERFRTRGGSNDVTFKLQITRGIIEELCFLPDEWMHESCKAALNALVGSKFPSGEPLHLESDRWTNGATESDEEKVVKNDQKQFINETITRFTTQLI